LPGLNQALVNTIRHADLKQFRAKVVPDGAAAAICIDLICAEEDGAFRAPKSDAQATRFAKWSNRRTFSWSFGGRRVQRANRWAFLASILRNQFSFAKCLFGDLYPSSAGEHRLALMKAMIRTGTTQ
jgi:hypothetical protein